MRLRFSPYILPFRKLTLTFEQFRENIPLNRGGRQNKLFGPITLDAGIQQQRRNNRLNNRGLGGKRLQRREAPMKGLANAPSQPKVISTKPQIGGKRLKVRNLDEKQVSNDDLKVRSHLFSNNHYYRDSLRRLANLLSVSSIGTTSVSSLASQQWSTKMQRMQRRLQMSTTVLFLTTRC